MRFTFDSLIIEWICVTCKSYVTNGVFWYILKASHSILTTYLKSPCRVSITAFQRCRCSAVQPWRPRWRGRHHGPERHHRGGRRLPGHVALQPPHAAVGTRGRPAHGDGGAAARRVFLRVPESLRARLREQGGGLAHERAARRARRAHLPPSDHDSSCIFVAGLQYANS